MRLSIKEREAVCAVLEERLAGCPQDLKDALGLESLHEAEKMMEALDRACTKLTERPPEKARKP